MFHISSKPNTHYNQSRIVITKYKSKKKDYKSSVQQARFAVIKTRRKKNVFNDGHNLLVSLPVSFSTIHFLE